jgi:PucR C-terminal helix-turn-helix domain/GGDEF-like domain
VGGRVKSAATSAGVSGSQTAELHDRLLARRAEIEQAILTRVYAISDTSEIADPEYAEGLRAAVGAAVDHGLAGIKGPGRDPPPVPHALLAQARLAARSRVALDTVLRRYVAGYALLGDFLIAAVEEVGEPMQGAALKRMMRVQANLFDRVLAAVGEEHRTEQRRRLETSERRQVEWVQRLLEGELLDTAELAYDFEAVHLALVAKGTGLAEPLRKLATALNRRLLLVCPTGQMAWAWFGGRREPDPEDLAEALAATLPGEGHVSLGEPAQGLEGWRRTHRQALAALPIALRGPEPVVRYADVALLASVLQDELLVTSLREIYLEPLQVGRDRGEQAKQTLRAYLTAQCNISSTAAALGINRKTVASRLQAIEAVIGRPVSSCLTELEAALQVEDSRNDASSPSETAAAPTVTVSKSPHLAWPH